MIKVCVIGLGYVGLPLCLTISKKFETIGFDINTQRITNLVKKKDIENINFLDENCFMYFEDSYLCQIAKRKKKSVIQIFDVKVKHIHGRSKVKNLFKRTFIRNYHFTHDQLYYYYKIGLKNEKYLYLKKKIPNYFVKMFLNLIIFRLNKSIYYFSLIKAFYDFNKLINSISRK